MTLPPTWIDPRAPDSAESSTDLATEQAGRDLMRGLAAIRRHQLPSGEIPTYQYDREDHYEYRRSPFISTFVHDALGYLDPSCPWFDPHGLEAIPASCRRAFVQALAATRRRIRAFIAWQEEPSGMWRFFGRSSGMDPDSDDTSCAATVLLECASSRSSDRCQRRFDALARFRSPAGPYFTWIGPDGRAYNGTDEGQQPFGFDRIVNANVLRYLALVGGDVRNVSAYLLNELERHDFQTGSPYYPNPLCFFYMVARAWRQAALPGRDRIASLLVPHVLGLQRADGAFGGPLATALAAATLCDLEYRGPALGAAMAFLLDPRARKLASEHEAFFVHGFGSPAWTVALSMMVLARAHRAAGIADHGGNLA